MTSNATDLLVTPDHGTARRVRGIEPSPDSSWCFDQRIDLSELSLQSKRSTTNLTNGSMLSNLQKRIASRYQCKDARQLSHRPYLTTFPLSCVSEDTF